MIHIDRKEPRMEIKLEIQTVTHSNFLDFIQCIVVCRYIGIVHLVEPDNYWVPSLWVLHSPKDYCSIRNI